jgi:C4-dicarboxylate-specific signal transduction histidine kinase
MRGGIPEDILPRTFEPFFTTKGAGEGTRLGLPISYGIATDMGCSIGAEPIARGTRFNLDLPRAAA